MSVFRFYYIVLPIRVFVLLCGGVSIFVCIINDVYIECVCLLFFVYDTRAGEGAYKLVRLYSRVILRRIFLMRGQETRGQGPAVGNGLLACRLHPFS